MNPLLFQFPRLFLPALNHLLAQEAWASQQLQPHATKVACFDLSLFSLKLKITAQGFVESASEEAIANVTIKLNPADIPLILQNQERAISYVNIEGL